MGWGIYILRLQFTFREELEAQFKWFTVAGVLIFLVTELFILRLWMGTSSGYYAFTTLALMLTTAALYGHLFVSIASQMAVDIIHPPDEHEPDVPDFSPAEALEQVGDYDGALKEYLVIGRIFPKDPDPVLRLAETYMHIDEKEKAAKYFERGLDLIAEPIRAQRVTNRLFGIYTRELEQPDKAKAILENFLQRYTGSEECAAIERRLKQLEEPKEESEVFQSTTGMLESMEPPSVDL